MRKLSSSVAWRLTIWFLLLSFLPIGTMALFVRHTVADAFMGLATHETYSQARLLAAEAAILTDRATLLSLLDAGSDENHASFIIDGEGQHLARSDQSTSRASLRRDLSAKTVERLLNQRDGGMVDEETDRLIGFSAVAGTGAIAVVVMDATLVSSAISRMEAASVVQLAAILAVTSILGGLAIWVLIGPIQQLKRAAEEVGAGNLNTEIDCDRMEGELEVLGTAFNQMTKQLRELYEDMEQRVADRTRELGAVNAISTVVSRSLDLSDILQAALEKTAEFTGIEAGAAYRLEPQSNVLVMMASRGLSDGLASSASKIPATVSMAWQAMADGQPVAVQVSDYPDGELRAMLEREGLRLIVAVPLVAKGQVLGALNLCTRTQRSLAPEDVSLLAAIGRQVGMAVENARLYEAAEESAVTAERNRLARDLHDAVTQTLFSTSLIAEVLPRLWQRDPAEGMRRLEELRQLSRGALAEMRTLLLELRPAALTEAPLGSLLRHLAEATTGRARLPVDLRIDGDRQLPPDIQVALYRIAQEALNNVAKHSGASEATITLHNDDDGLELAIGDNGCGFDTSLAKPEHLGLDIIRERVKAIGAELTIDSAVGRGTKVTVWWLESSDAKRSGET